ncbi:cellulase family glycosylhydrolase [Micromonospora echinospora]
MRHRHAVLAASAAGVLALGSMAAVTLPASAATTGCAVTYTVASQWPDGFTANITITNLGSAVTGWTLGFTFPNAAQRVGQGWSAKWTQSGSEVTATSMAWNGSLDTGSSTSIGFSGTWRGTNPVPDSFALNGTTCTGAVTTPTASPTTVDPSPTASNPPDPGGPAPKLRVSGNKIVTASGRPYRLLGVSRSSGEYACVQGKGQWDGGPVDQASVDAMKTWNIHAVRIPLNEECWLGVNGTPSGATYQQGVKDYVDLLVANGINPILDLHWTWGAYSTGPDWHCKDTTATCQKPMPDARYAPQFWTGVANTFKGNDAVVFDLFNEPYPEIGADWNKTLGWQCLRDGGTCAGIPYEVAGMQDLVDAVRATGATNMLMVGGLEWTNDMGQWLTYKPSDPLGNIAASWHAYSFNACASTTCWEATIAPLAEEVPVVLGEFGQDNCGYDYMDTLMEWVTAHGLSHLAWTWNPWGCSTGAVLIKDWQGTPEPGVGEGYRAHLLSQDPYATR